MREKPFLPRRRSVRLNPFDYSQPHSYFITICAQDRRPLFGRVVDNKEVALTKTGKIVDECWPEIPSHFPTVALAPHVVMPDHLHGILILQERNEDGTGAAKHPLRARHAVPLQPQREFAAPTIGSIPTIIGAFKAAVTRRLNDIFGKRKSIWQRGYYEHVIWRQDEFRETCEYIRTNPARRAHRESFPYGHGMPCPATDLGNSPPINRLRAFGTRVVWRASKDPRLARVRLRGAWPWPEGSVWPRKPDRESSSQ